MTTDTFSRINLWLDNANGATGWMVRATRTDGRVVEEALGSLQGEVRGRYDLPQWATEDAADALGLDSLPGPAAWSWTGQVYTLDPAADPTADIDALEAELELAANELDGGVEFDVEAAITALADAWVQQGGQHAIVAVDVDDIATVCAVRPAFVVARARALGVPVL